MAYEKGDPNWREPEAGEVVQDLGCGVTVVKRSRQPKDERMQWVAPFSVNCERHGWVVSRRSAAMAETAAGDHLRDEHRGETGPPPQAGGFDGMTVTGVLWSPEPSDAAW